MVHRCCAFLFVLAELYLFAKTTQIVSDFFTFQIFEKWANLQLSLNVQKPKVFQLQGALPLTL